MLLIKSMMVTIAIDKWGGSSTNSPRSMHFTVVYACAGFAYTLSIQSQSVCARTESVHTLKAYHITPYTNTNTVQITTITDKRMRIPRLSYMLNAHYVYKCECVRVCLSVRVYEHELIALASLFIFFIRFAFISFDLLFVFLFMRLSWCFYVCVCVRTV